MYDPNRDENVDDLLRRVDDLLTQEDDLSEYAPKDIDVDEPVSYRNFSNNYGQEVPPEEPDLPDFSNARSQGETIQAYNPDFPPAKAGRSVPRPDSRREEPQQKKEKKEKKPGRKKRGCCGIGCGGLILVVAALIVGAVLLVQSFVQPPRSDYAIGDRKDDTATILLCGVDKDGTRTDTMMLLYLSGEENRVSLLSLPRDTYTITAAGKAAKLNSAYGRNGTGVEGVEGMMDYIQDIIGYRPDGYILVDFSIVKDVVEIMGGVEFDVPQEIAVDDVVLQPGYQHLDGKQVLALLRYRKGYYNADLGRVEMQRQVLQACLEQWLTPGHIQNLGEALSQLQSKALTNLELPNYLWMGKTILGGIGNLSSDTLPGYPQMRSGASYYVLYPDQVAELINRSYNPFRVEITQSMLNIAG